MPSMRAGAWHPACTDRPTPIRGARPELHARLAALPTGASAAHKPIHDPCEQYGEAHSRASLAPSRSSRRRPLGNDRALDTAARLREALRARGHLAVLDVFPDLDGLGR